MLLLLKRRVSFHVSSFYIAISSPVSVEHSLIKHGLYRLLDAGDSLWDAAILRMYCGTQLKGRSERRFVIVVCVSVSILVAPPSPLSQLCAVLNLSSCPAIGEEDAA